MSNEFDTFSLDGIERTHVYLSTLKRLLGSRESAGIQTFYAEHVEALLATNNIDRAHREAELLVERATRVDRVSGLATGQRSRVLVAAARGQLDEATSHLARAIEAHAGSWVSVHGGIGRPPGHGKSRH